MSSAQPPPSDSQTSSEQGASATSATSSAGSAGGAGGGEKKQLPSVVEVDASNIEQVMVQSYGMPTILDCHAEWCQPCKQLAPILEDLVARSGGRLRLAKLDVDANKELAAQLRVQSLPTVYGIAGGKVVDQFVGLPQQEQFQSFVDKLMKHGESSAAAGAAPADSTGSKTPAEIFDAGAMALRQGAFDVARNAFETVIALEESEADAIAAKTKRDGGRKLTPKTDEQVKIEEMAAAAHASIAQLLLMSGDAEAAQSYLSTFRKKPKWSQYVGEGGCCNLVHAESVSLSSFSNVGHSSFPDPNAGTYTCPRYHNRLQSLSCTPTRTVSSRTLRKSKRRWFVFWVWPRYYCVLKTLIHWFIVAGTHDGFQCRQRIRTTSMHATPLLRT